MLKLLRTLFIALMAHAVFVSGGIARAQVLLPSDLMGEATSIDGPPDGFVAEPILIAQRRTLFDLLFGGGDDAAEADAPAETSASPAPVDTGPRVTRVVAAIPKIAGATRLMVFGDSFASDLAKALDRKFEEDENLIVLNNSVGITGFVRADYYDWNAALREEIAADSFDLAVVNIGINDRQPINGASPLTDAWKAAYLERLDTFLGQMRTARKPVIWVGLPPMRAESYSDGIAGISSMHRLASIAGGAEFVDIYERFTDEDGNYVERGPDLNGQDVVLRRNDGIHFREAGSDKVAFFVGQAIQTYYRGGSVNLEIEDPLEGTDAQAMVRLPFQGNGEVGLLQVAGAVLPLNSTPQRASQLLVADPNAVRDAPFTLSQLVRAPIGRVDDFGVGIDFALAQEAQEASPELGR